MFGKPASRAVGVLTTCLALGACSDGPTTSSGTGTLVVSAQVTATTATIVLEVTAPDIPNPLVFNIAIVDGVATGTVTVPAGSNRTLTLRAFDTGAVETHRGSTTRDIQAGTNATVTLVLDPLSGEIPIDGTLGSLTITVTPATPTLAEGETVQLSATILDANGDPVSATPNWATSHPGIASVDAAGLVTGEGAGTTTIVATHGGAAGSATVTVTAPVTAP